MKMHLHEENDLVLKTIQENSHIFPVYKREDINDFKNIFFKIKLRKTLLMNKHIDDLKELKELFQLMNRNPLEFDINFDVLERINIQKKRDKFTEISNNLSCQDNVIKYRNIENLNDSRNIIIYNHYVFLTLNKGGFFGDFAFENENRTR